MLVKRKEGNPNPTGGKPDKLMRDALMVALKREAKDADGKKTTKLYLIANRLVDVAIAGDIPAIKEIFDRVDGRQKEQIDLNATGTLNVESSAVSAVVELLASAIAKRASGDNANALPNGSVLLAPVRVQA